MVWLGWQTGILSVFSSLLMIRNTGLPHQPQPDRALDFGVQYILSSPCAVVEIGFDITSYIVSEAAVVPLCVKMYSGQLGTELALELLSDNGSTHGW